MNLPFFTARDPDLLRADTGRDPLGLLPVWAELGRRLVPIIAGPVTRLDGIKAVLAIHYVHARLFERDGASEGVSFRRFFRLMEGLLEAYLHKNGRHCFGTRRFASGTEFTVRRDDSSTAVNGLYQYYRGTCGRAGLLDNGMLSPEASDVLAAEWNKGADKALRSELLACAKDGRRTLHPGTLLDAEPLLRQSLDNCFESAALNTLLFDRLFGKEHHSVFARHCSRLRKEPVAEDHERYGPVRNLVERLSAALVTADADAARPLAGQLEYVRLCEPFLVTVQDSFDYLLRSSAMRIGTVAADLAAFGTPIRERAQDFLRLEDVVKNPRSQQLMAVARAANEGVSPFLQAVLAHHSTVAVERGRDPMARLEGSLVLSLTAPDRSTGAILKRLENGFPWDNGYYLSTAGSLYAQAQKACRG